MFDPFDGLLTSTINPTYNISDLAYTPHPAPNLITGEGHGHLRRGRNKAVANITKKQKKARQMTKRSRRQNRKRG